MAKFCGKCGAKLDESTGLCPNCHADRFGASTEPAHEALKNKTDVPSESAQEQPLSKKEIKKKMRAEKKAAKKIERKQRKANKKAEKREKNKAKWAAKSFGQKVWCVLLRLLAWLLILIILAVGITGSLVYFDIVDIPAVNMVLTSLELKDINGVTKENADDYFNKNATVISEILVTDSQDILCEADVCDELSSRGFIQYPIVTEYSMEGSYSDSVEISDNSSVEHPMYQTNYVNENGDIWTVYVINNQVLAFPVSYNLQSNLGVQVVLSESAAVTSYDSDTNCFYQTIPASSALIVIKVDKIDAKTLENYLFKEIDNHAR